MNASRIGTIFKIQVKILCTEMDYCFISKESKEY